MQIHYVTWPQLKEISQLAAGGKILEVFGHNFEIFDNICRYVVARRRREKVLSTSPKIWLKFLMAVQLDRNFKKISKGELVVGAGNWC